MRRHPSSWLLARFAPARRKRSTRRRNLRNGRCPTLESLEPRHMLSITVDTLVDENDGPSGNVSFREALAMAADEVNHPGHDTIDFSPALFNNGPATLTLAYDGNDAGFTPDQIAITASHVTVEGPGAELLSIDGDNQYRVFTSTGTEI
jgi:hypothetical protein